jgi:hypothetical protein
MARCQKKTRVTSPGLLLILKAALFLFLACTAVVLAYFVPPPAPSDMPSFLVPGYTPWAEDQGPFVSTREIKILNWCSFLAWDMSGNPIDFIRTDIGACRVSTDHSLVATADVVWFNWKDISSVPSIPRPHGALWVYYLLESPAYSFNRHDDKLSQLRDQINMMVTYQSNSDIVDRHYGYLLPRPEPLSQNVVPPWSGKTEFMVAMISNTVSKLRDSRIDVCVPRAMDHMWLVNIYVMAVRDGALY